MIPGGEVGVDTETVNEWSHSRLVSSMISNGRQRFAPFVADVSKEYTRLIGGVKSKSSSAL